MVEATIDYWNDRDDVYRVYLHAGEQLTATESGTSAAGPSLALWRPGTIAVDAASVRDRRLLSRPAGTSLSFRADAAGWYLLDVRMIARAAGAYRLTVAKAR